MSFSSVTDAGLSSLDYASRYSSEGPDLRGGDPHSFRRSDADRAASTARSTEYVQGLEDARSARSAAEDPDSAVSFALSYGSSVAELKSLAMSNPDRAAKAYDRLESGIDRYRSQLVRLAGLHADDPLSRTVAMRAAEMLDYHHRTVGVRLDGTGGETSIGAMFGPDGRAARMATSRLRQANFDDATISAYTGDDPFRKGVAEAFVKPVLDMPPSSKDFDPLRLQRVEASHFALANADGLKSTFGEAGTLHLLHGISAMQGTAGGVRHLIDTFLRYGKARRAGAGEDFDGYRLASDTLQAYETLTTDMFQSTGRERALSDSEKRFAAMAVMGAMDAAGPDLDLTNGAVRYAMRNAASVFARSRAYGVDLFRAIKDSSSQGSPRDAIGRYIGDVSKGLEPSGAMEAVDRFQRTLDDFIRGSDGSTGVSAEVTGDAGVYTDSVEALRRQKSESPGADSAAKSIAKTTYSTLLPRLLKTGDIGSALQSLRGDEAAFGSFFGSLVQGLQDSMSLHGDAGRDAAALVAERFIKALDGSDGAQGPFSVVRAVTDIVFSKEGLRTVEQGGEDATGVGALRAWYRRGVVDEARYKDQMTQVRAHLRSKFGGGYGSDAAAFLAADVRSLADQALMNGSDPTLEFDKVLRKGSYFAIDDSQIIDGATGLPRLRVKGDLKDVPDLDRGTAVVKFVQNKDLPKDYRTNRAAFEMSQRILQDTYQRNLSNFSKIQSKNAEKMAKLGLIASPMVIK